MRYQVLDTVVLDRDLAEHRLRKGDLGHTHVPPGPLKPDPRNLEPLVGMPPK